MIQLTVRPLLLLSGRARSQQRQDRDSGPNTRRSSSRPTRSGLSGGVRVSVSWQLRPRRRAHGRTPAAQVPVGRPGPASARQ